MTNDEIQIGKFNGMLGGFALGVFNTLIAFPGLVREIGKLGCHMIAADYMSDMGNLIKTDEAFASKVSKASKNGERSISGKIKTAKGASTNCMTFVYVMQTIDDLRGSKDLKERFTPPMESFPDGVQLYLNRIKARITPAREADAPAEKVTA